MEETDLLKERLQAITVMFNSMLPISAQEKHHIQEDIRQRKLQLEQEKLKLKYLKKKVLREQWLLSDSTFHNAANSPQQHSALSDQQQTRALQLNIHKIAMEVESLEREESMISTKESLILNRLKAVEKSSEDIIKEAQESCVPKPLQVTTLIPESPSPDKKHSKPNTPRKSLFAMEINGTKKQSAEEGTVRSTGTVPSGEINQHAGLKVYDDGRKCVHALNPQEGSHQSFVSKLSVNEVEQLLNAPGHSHVNHLNYHQHHSRAEEVCFDNHRNESDRVYMYGLKHQGDHGGNHNCGENWQRKLWVKHQESQYRGQEERNNKSNLRETHHHYSLHQLRNQKVVCTYQQQLQYTPVSYTPTDYISMDEQDLYCFSPPSYHNNARGEAAVVYSNNSGHSPLCEDNTSYIILNNTETTEPVTAIFMGFQMAQDDTGHFQDFEGSLRAELVTIEDNEDSNHDKSIIKKSHTQLGGNCYPTGTLANGNNGHVEGVGNRWMERQVGPGIRKIKKKHKSCCTVC